MHDVDQAVEAMAANLVAQLLNPLFMVLEAPHAALAALADVPAILTPVGVAAVDGADGGVCERAAAGTGLENHATGAHAQLVQNEGAVGGVDDLRAVGEGGCP